MEVFSVFGEEYCIDKDKKVLYFTNEKGKFIVPFSYLDSQVKAYKSVNRIHKPVYVLFYTDWKNKANLVDNYGEPEIVSSSDINAKVKDFEMVR